MAIQRKEDPPQGAAAWMSTFSDLMNLLLCFFVMLFAMSTMDAGKYAKIVESFKGRTDSDFSIFKEETGNRIFDDKIFPTSVQQVENLSSMLEDTGEETSQSGKEENKVNVDAAKKAVEEEQKKKAEALYQQLTKQVEKDQLEGMIEVDMDKKYQYVKLTLSGAVLFESGESKVKQDALKVLDKVALILRNYRDNLIKIEGHTDNIPTTSGSFDNMDLSNARACSVWRYMVKEKHLRPEKLEASGRSQYDPIESNQTAEGRAKNRRVEFKIYTEGSMN